MNHSDTLATCYANLGLPDAAAKWLLDLWAFIQVMDDAADGADIKRADAERATWLGLVGMQCNPFYLANAESLLPVLSLQIAKWRAANEAEATGRHDEQSYMWRAGYYDVVLMVCLLCGITGQEAAILGMYGESFRDYMGEQDA